MASPADLIRILRGCFQIFLGRPEGLRAFDTSYAGFWASFGALVPMAPFIAVMILSERLYVLRGMDYPEDFSPAAFLAARLIAILVDWFGFPILLAVLARSFGFGARYVPLVVALNWSSLAVIIPFSLPHLLHIAGLIDGDTTGVLHLLLLAGAIRLEYLAARFALGGGAALLAGAIVSLDVASSIFLDVSLSAILSV